MEEFFKRVGIGLAVIVLSPLWILAFLLYFSYATIMLILSPLKIMIYFLQRRNYTIKSHYDKEAERRLKMQDYNFNNQQQSFFQSPNNHVNYNFPNGNNVSPFPNSNFTPQSNNYNYNQNMYNNQINQNLPNFTPNNYPDSKENKKWIFCYF